jgi:UDP-N-acetylmuramoylalanine--D-glutamate ligase
MDQPPILDSDIINFCIYGMGTTGHSVCNYFHRKNFKEYKVWDDDEVLRSSYGFKMNKKKGENLFSKHLDNTDYIVLSPGISLKKAKLKKKLLENKDKIITDLDLFYLFNPKIKTIVVTGTNGKSTTCKILEHVLNKNNINVKLGGNIGRPILDLNLKNQPIVIIEASSFQLAYSQYIKPDYAIILNITKDHLDWHGSYKNYVDSKFKIFKEQKKNNFAFINNKILINKFKNEKYESKLKFINLKRYNKIRYKIKNDYLNSEANKENMSFVYALSKVLNINEKSLINSLKSFKGLPHRQEIFYKKNNKTFINDSKATSFKASKLALKSNKNIFWIVGGLPKKGDKIKLGNFKKNIAKTYIIGKHMQFFQKQLKGKIKIQLCKNLKKAITTIFEDIKKIKRNEKITVLLSPSSASYDQFKNFEERGNSFKFLVNNKIRSLTNV